MALFLGRLLNVTQQLLSKNFAMLAVSYAASGEKVAAIAAEDALFARGELNIRRLRQYLAKTHFQQVYTRFQLKIVDQAGVLDNDLIITAPAEVQLMILTYPETNSNEELEIGLLGAYQSGALQEVEDCLEALIHPNTAKMWDPLHHVAGAGYPEIVKILKEARAEVDAKDIHGKHRCTVPPWAGGVPRGFMRCLACHAHEVFALAEAQLEIGGTCGAGRQRIERDRRGVQRL